MNLYESHHLSLSDLGAVRVERLDLAELFDRVRLGDVEDDPDWPARLGHEPGWYLTELEELVDAWQDAQRFAEGCRAEVRRAYTESRLR